MPSAADKVAQFRIRSLLSVQRSVMVDERFFLASLISKLPSLSSIVFVSRLQLDRFSTLVASDAIDDTEIEISDRSVEKLSCDGERRMRCDTVRADGTPCWKLLAATRLALAVLLLLLLVTMAGQVLGDVICADAEFVLIILAAVEVVDVH
uniref:(northern house mosquito) hypothetical protein n=1 Tax=Culex pipiens TaxID=7175 RepID=A0A8D8B939_CULPI